MRGDDTASSVPVGSMKPWSLLAPAFSVDGLTRTSIQQVDFAIRLNVKCADEQERASLGCAKDTQSTKS